MKKIFTLLAISLVLVLPIVSCTADDESAKQAQTDKESLEIPADTDNSNIQHNQLALYASATQVPAGTLVTFTTMLNGVDVTNQASYFVNNIAVGGSSIASVSPGTFYVKAKLEGYIDSPTVTVVYGNGTNPNPQPNPVPEPQPEPTPNGNFIYNGQSHNVVANVLVLNGAFSEGAGSTPYSSWTSIILNNTNPDLATIIAVIDFKTPFTITNPETNVGTITFPNGTNEVYSGAQEISILGDDFEDVVGTGAIHYQNLNVEATTNAFTSNISFNGNTLQINYNGAFGYVNNSQPAQKSSIKSTKNLVKISTKKPTNHKINK